MKRKSIKQRMRNQQRKQAIISNLIWIGVGLAVVGVIGLFAWQGIRPLAGETIPIMAGSDTHIPVDSDPGSYNSNPPTSGPHYPNPLGPGFYDINPYEYPAGYLVHNMEHGYVIFWYNCDLLDEPACEELKSQIQSTMLSLGGTKMIAYPWPSLDVPFAMTSWGQLAKFDEFDAGKAKAFYNANLNRSPEPGAQ